MSPLNYTKTGENDVPFLCLHFFLQLYTVNIYGVCICVCVFRLVISQVLVAIPSLTIKHKTLGYFTLRWDILVATWLLQVDDPAKTI